MKAVRMAVLIILALIVVGAKANAQTTYTSTSVKGWAGEPWADFGFMDNLDLYVQCNNKIAWFRINYGTINQELGHFALACTYTSPFTVENTPFTVTIPMYYENGSNPLWGQFAGNVTLTVKSVEFTEATRYVKAIGTAVIEY